MLYFLYTILTMTVIFHQLHFIIELNWKIQFYNLMYTRYTHINSPQFRFIASPRLCRQCICNGYVRYLSVCVRTMQQYMQERYLMNCCTSTHAHIAFIAIGWHRVSRYVFSSLSAGFFARSRDRNDLLLNGHIHTACCIMIKNLRWIESTKNSNSFSRTPCWIKHISHHIGTKQKQISVPCAAWYARNYYISLHGVVSMHNVCKGNSIYGLKKEKVFQATKNSVHKPEPNTFLIALSF